MKTILQIMAKKAFSFYGAGLFLTSLAVLFIAQALPGLRTVPVAASREISGATSGSAASAQENITIGDARRVFTVKKNPRRVISLDNRTFETLSDWGIELIAAPKDVMPKNSPYIADKRVQNIGNHREPNLEIIASAEPELIITGQRFAGYYDTIKKLAPNAAVLDFDIDVSRAAYATGKIGQNLINGLKEHTNTLGIIFGYEARAKELNEQLDAAIKRVKDSYNPEKTVMSISVSGGRTGYIAPGFGRIFGPWYEILGLKHALDIGRATTNHQGDEVSVEAIVKSNPYYILVFDRDAAISGRQGSLPAKDVIENSAAMKELEAVKEGRVIYAPQDIYTNESIQGYIRMLTNMAEAFAKN